MSLIHVPRWLPLLVLVKSLDLKHYKLMVLSYMAPNCMESLCATTVFAPCGCCSLKSDPTYNIANVMVSYIFQCLSRLSGLYSDQSISFTQIVLNHRGTAYSQSNRQFQGIFNLKRNDWDAFHEYS